jgi:DNA-binding NarL/FixJ family response regulator
MAIDSTRVLLIDMPRILREVIREVLIAQPDIEIAGELESEEGVAIAAEESAAEVIIFGSEERELPAAWRKLLEQRPGLRVLTVLSDGRESYLYELRPHRVPLGEVSPEGLLRAIRTPAAA